MPELRRGDWGRLYADMAESPKHLFLSLAADGLWTRCLAWAFRWSDDGFVPRYLVEQKAGRSENVDALAAEMCSVAPGETHPLWHPATGGWVFHDWSDHQTPRSERDRKRSETAERQQRFRTRNASHGGSVTRYSGTTSRVATEGEVEGESVLENRDQPTVLRMPSQVDRAVTIWNEHKAPKQPPIRVVPPKMARDLQAFLQQLDRNLDAFAQCVDAFAADEFMSGRDPRARRAYGLDTMVRPANCAKWINVGLDGVAPTSSAAAETQYTDVDYITGMGGPDEIDRLLAGGA